MADYKNCPNCGQPVGSDDKFCSSCGLPIEKKIREEVSPSPAETLDSSGGVPIPPVAPIPAEEQKYVPWEDRQKIGFFKALWETWKESVFYPNRFFARAPYGGGLASPLLFAVIAAWTGFAISQLTRLMVSGFTIGFLTSFIHNERLLENLGMLGGLSILQVFGILVLMPFMIIILLFIASGVYHLILMIFGWSKRNFEATFRAVAYGTGAIIFNIVPMCGSFIGTIWAIVVTIIGIKHLQKTSGGQATLVVLLPIILCCCLVGLIAIVATMLGVALFRDIIGGNYYYD
jgi:hypothetical protein